MAKASLSGPVAPAVPSKLPFRTKLAFGAGDLGTALTAAIIAFFQLFFLTTVAGMRPTLAGTVVLIVKIWDAVNDPVVGWLSDRTRSRFGRRRLWMLLGAVPFGIIFFFLWIVPPFTDLGKFFYYLIITILFNVIFTVVNVPYTALTPELTTDYDERTSLNSYRFAFSIAAGLIAGALHPLLVNSFCADASACLPAESRTGYMVAGAVWGVFSIPFFLWCVFGTRESYRASEETASLSIVAQVRAVFSTRPYLFVIGIYLCSWLAVQVTASVLIFYVTFWMQRAELIPVVLLAVQGSAFVFLFMWNLASRRIGKQAVYIIGMVFWIGVQLCLFFVQPQQVALAIGLAALAGVGISTAYLVPWSMLPDVIEYDELRTGERREGIFYGFMVFLQKLGLALGLFLVGVGLEAFGFDQNAGVGQQPEMALTAIRIMVGPVPAIALIVGIILTAFYPITRRVHAEMLAELAARREKADKLTR